MRNRYEEKDIQLDYLKDLHNLYDLWLIEEKHFVPAPVIVLNANEDLSNIKYEFIRKKTDIIKHLSKKQKSNR